MPTKAPASAATTGYEAELWKMADALRGSMDAADSMLPLDGCGYRKTPRGQRVRRHRRGPDPKVATKATRRRFFQRQAVLDAAWARNPERFVSRPLEPSALEVVGRLRLEPPPEAPELARSHCP